MRKLMTDFVARLFVFFVVRSEKSLLRRAGRFQFFRYTVDKQRPLSYLHLKMLI